jgi:hypothetical protein
VRPGFLIMVVHEKTSLIPFFPYETRDQNKQVEIVRRKYKQRALEHRAKFAALWKASAESQAKATSRSKASIQRSIELARIRTKQFVNLAKIDQSIVRERTREYLYTSTKRIKNEMVQAHQSVRSTVGVGSPVELSLKEQMNRARNHVAEKAIAIELSVMHSARQILERKEMTRKRYAETYNNAQRKVEIGKEKTRKARHALNLEGVNRPDEYLTSENPNIQAELDLSQKNVKSASTNFVENARRAKQATEKAGQEALSIGQSHLRQMQKNILASKELFEVDVRFAQAKVREASKKSKVIGIQMTVALSERRKTAIMRAKARRKVQAIRNALTLIRTIG